MSYHLSSKLEIAPRVFGQDWEGQTAILLGNGPSLLAREPGDFEKPNSRLVVCNGGYLRFPDAHLLVASDRKWLLAESQKDEPFAGYRGGEILITRPESAKASDERMVYVKRTNLAQWTGGHFDDPGLIVEGWTSVTTMIAAAVMRGASRIILLGVDLQPGEGGRKSTYDESVDTAAKARYARQVQHLEAQMPHVKRAAVEVLNCSPDSALRCYPYVAWEDVQW